MCFLGSNLAKSYLEDEAEIYIVDSLFRDGSEKNLNWLQSLDTKNKIKFFRIDISDKDLVNKVFKQYAPFDLLVMSQSSCDDNIFRRSME